MNQTLTRLFALFFFLSTYSAQNSLIAAPLKVASKNQYAHTSEHDEEQSALAIRVDSLLNEYFPSENAPGAAIMIVKDGSVLYKKSIGKANLELDTDIHHGSLFRIGSNTKPFTAMAILKLAEDGQISLQDDITRYISDYPTDGHTITIEHLLTHTSGIRNFTSVDGFSQAQTKNYSPEDFIDFFKHQPMDFPPGSQYRYSNSGYFLLGYIIEKVTKQSYARYLKSTFFTPLGMNNTTYDNPRRIIKNRTSGYVPDEGYFLNGKHISMTVPYSAGALLSTTEDLTIWYQAVMDGEVVSQASLKKALTPYKLNDGTSTCCGYAWFLGNLLGSPIIGHTGGITGYYSTLVYLPQDEVFVVGLTNCNWQNIDFENLSTKLAALAIEKPYFEPKKKDINAAFYAGTYTSPTGDNITLIVENDELFLVGRNESKWILFEANNDTFYNEIDFTTFRFVRNSKGQIVSLSSLRHAEPVQYHRKIELTRSQQQ